MYDRGVYLLTYQYRCELVLCTCRCGYECRTLGL